MMGKIISKHRNILQTNPELRETLQNNSSVAFKINKNLQEIIEGYTVMEKCLKLIQKTERKI